MARRRLRDFYQTAAWQVDALIDHLPELAGSVWCPCVGDGSLLRRLLERRPDLGPVVTNDLDPNRRADFHGDATRLETWRLMEAQHGRPDWIVDNPPFSVAIDIAAHAFEMARQGLVLMTRVSFPEGTRAAQHQGRRVTPRGPWLSAHPRQQQIALERYSFTGDGGTDSASTEWLVWSKVPISRPGGHTAYGYKPEAPVRGADGGPRRIENDQNMTRQGKTKGNGHLP